MYTYSTVGQTLENFDLRDCKVLCNFGYLPNRRASQPANWYQKPGPVIRLL